MTDVQTDLQLVVAKVTDPVHAVVEDVVKRTRNRKIGLLIDAVMGNLPGPIPDWARRPLRVGIHREVKAELKAKGYVLHDGTYRRLADLTLREGWGYVNALQDSADRDLARIARIKADLVKAEQAAGSIDSPRSIGDLLGWTA